MSESVPRRHALRELEALLLDPGWADGAGAEFLVVDFAAGEDAGPSLADAVAGVPVPVVAVGARPDTALADAMDVWADSDDELATIVARIRENPTASAVLVQVLRSSVRLPVLEALALESLGYATLQSGREFARWLGGRERRAPKPAPGHDAVLLARCDDALELVLNTPRNRNALSVAMRDALTEAFELVAMTPEIQQIDVRGNGPSFSAGGDLTEFGSTDDPSVAHEIRMRRMPARYLAPEAHRYHFHVHGACVGAGIELAAFAGRVTAVEETFFQLPEVAMGLIPGAGGCVSIPRRIGRQRTAFMALTGLRVAAREALAWGLIDAIED